jgi:xylose dehydrogenase (NAD/NADP)
VTPVRWGLLGAGFVASRGVAPAMREADGVVVQAVAARDLERAESLGAVRATTSYDELCEADDVDAVYISLPNDSHLRWVAAALRAGKHVLCEKPLALDAAQVAEMTALATSCDRLLVEASWNRWHPRTRRAADLLSDVAGSVEVRTWFTFPGVPADNYRLDPSRGGGALLDVGCYAIGTALLSLGDDVRVVTAEQHMSASGVDLTTTAALESPRGRAEITGSFEQDESQGWTVSAEGFELTMEHPAFTSWHEPSTLRVRQGDDERVESFDACDPYRLMVEEVSRRIQGDEGWVLPHSTSLAVARVIDAISSAAVRS